MPSLKHTSRLWSASIYVSCLGTLLNCTQHIFNIVCTHQSLYACTIHSFWKTARERLLGIGDYSENALNRFLLLSILCCGAGQQLFCMGLSGLAELYVKILPWTCRLWYIINIKVVWLCKSLKCDWLIAMFNIWSFPIAVPVSSHLKMSATHKLDKPMWATNVHLTTD